MSNDESLWSILVSQERKGQRKGRIRDTSRFTNNSNHNNRAGHRLYVKLNQTRSFRKSVVCFGRWRKGRRIVKGEESWAFQSGNPYTIAVDRRELRPGRVYQAKQNRRNGLRPGWRRP
jgi:hypothetical protein